MWSGQFDTALFIGRMDKTLQELQRLKDSALVDGNNRKKKGHAGDRCHSMWTNWEKTGELRV